MSINKGNMERQFADWGRQLDEFRKHSEELGEDAIRELERQYNDLKMAAEGLGEKAQESADTTLDTADKMDAAARSRAGKARQDAEDLAQRARAAGADVGQGFEMAWESLRQSFERAQQRLCT